ncbi:MAG: c-type cytochrome [Luteolibacter sp.]|uniref:c-type cytochrome n=1 Tax=Luteolibacter sp. TaxID=1962973 RepID=UPI0032670BAF
MRLILIPLFLLLAALHCRADAVGKPESGQSAVGWIWKSATPADRERVFFRREFELPPNVASAAITIVCDDWHHLLINGVDLGMAGDWHTPRTYDVLPHLKQGGRNVIAVEGRNDRGAAGMALRFRATLKDGKKLHVVSDATWFCSNESPEGWQNIDFQADSWPKAVVVAKMGGDPWGAVVLPPEPADLPEIKGPDHEWSIDEVVKLAESSLDGRDKSKGRDMFRASQCAACHRVGNEGATSGPDLSSLTGKLSVHDLAEAMIEPGKVVSDPFVFELITRQDGTQITGRILEEKDGKLTVATNPFDFSQTIEIQRNDIKESKHSPVSPMPAGLINHLNPDELKDLLAWLLGK